jgi:hypothetical protein
MPYIEFSPFHVYSNPTHQIIRAPKMKMPIFSNNAQVYYKPKSFAAGGIGTVRNSGAKGRRT